MRPALVFIVGALLGPSCGGGGGFPDGATAEGTFAVSWTLTDTSQQVIPCDQVGALQLSVTVTNHAGAIVSVEPFFCGTAMGTSHGLPTDIYDLSFELEGSTGTIGMAAPQPGVHITAGKTTQLAPLTFAIDATGGVALTATTNATGGNCAATTSGGAGITSTTITFSQLGGSCAPVTFMIGAGATRPASNYTVNCAMPAVGPCIDADQTIGVSGVTSGHYQLAMTGKVGAASCWTDNDSLTVPPLGRVLMRTLTLSYATGTPGCP